MSSIIQTMQNKIFFSTNQSLPLSQAQQPESAEKQGLRRRLSSLSLNLQPITSPASSWGDALRMSKSVSYVGEMYAGSSVRRWWDMGWAWIVSRKPSFAQDLEMNEEEKSFLGSQSKGSWRHVFYKVRSELRKLIGSDHNVTLPQTFKYDSFNYKQSFDQRK